MKRAKAGLIAALGCMAGGCGSGLQPGTVLNLAGLLFPRQVEAEDGIDGMDGASGVDGERGADGVGVDGATGPQGEQGPPGANGETGRAGMDGGQGDPGRTGPQGETGRPGKIGPQGPPGECDCVAFCHYHEIDDTGDPHDAVTGPPIPCE